MTTAIVDRPIISADSHITEPPDCYEKYIDPKFRDRAPYVVHDDERGDVYVIPGMRKPTPLSLTASAGIPSD